jgi:hypothetical protein
VDNRSPGRIVTIADLEFGWRPDGGPRTRVASLARTKAFVALIVQCQISKGMDAGLKIRADKQTASDQAPRIRPIYEKNKEHRSS